MRLVKVNYSETEDAKSWELKDLVLQGRNLIVGKNAVGKTRTFRIIWNLAAQIITSPQRNGRFEFDFKDNDTNYKYLVEISNKNIVLLEELWEKDYQLINRNAETNDNFIRNKSNNQDNKEPFSPPQDRFTIHVRRDTQNYPYLESLYNWANNCFCFEISKSQPDKSLTVSVPATNQILKSNILDAMGIYLENAFKDFGEKTFLNELLKDIERIGYNVSSVNVKKTLKDLSLIHSLVIDENNVGKLPQSHISSGMYRALAILIIINYWCFENKPVTLIIDDLGDGLDYSRSAELLKILFEKFEKIEENGGQLIVTTNNQFLMNAVPIKHWNILEREGSKVKAYNYYNSKQAFDEFDYIGLNNFEFFVRKFYRKNQLKKNNFDLDKLLKEEDSED